MLLDVHPVAAILIAGPIGALVAIPVAALMFRLRGAYFAIGTWVIAEVFRLLASQISALGGGSGISLPASVVVAMTEDGEEFAHALLQQTQDKRLRERRFDQLGQAFGKGLFDAASLADRTRPRANCSLAVAAREHQLVFSAAAFRTGFQREISVLSRFAR